MRNTESLSLSNSDLILFHNLLVSDAKEHDRHGYPHIARDRSELAAKVKAEVERREHDVLRGIQP